VVAFSGRAKAKMSCQFFSVAIFHTPHTTRTPCVILKCVVRTNGGVRDA
jgi:hypothetical protein